MELRSLFNQPEVVDLLQRDYPLQAVAAYWRGVLRYCIEGCLQSVIDEYTHVLRDHLGLTTGDEGERVHEIADEVISALSLRTPMPPIIGLGGFPSRNRSAGHLAGADTTRKQRCPRVRSSVLLVGSVNFHCIVPPKSVAVMRSGV